MTSCELPKIRVSNPGDLIETVPYLMGFHPSESLVMVGFSGSEAARPQTVRVTMRIDLPSDPIDFDALKPLTDAFECSQCDSVVVIAMTEQVNGDPRGAPAIAALLDALVADLSLSGLQVLDVLVASDSRWWSMLCDSEECCPPAGSPRHLSGSVAAAEATLAGLVALPDRQALAATLAGASAAARAALLPAVQSADQRRQASFGDRAGRRRWQRTETAALLKAARRQDSTPVTDEQVARFVAALTDISVRDALWLAIDNGSLDAEALLVQLHSRAPSTHVAAPLFLFGWAQWRSGNGTLAMMAAEQALLSDPTCTAASLLVGAIQRGLDPRVAPPLSELSDQASRPG
ncbi:MAG: DUF4192 domain-containing protein [Jatrophihabitantaceae bacterium]